MSGASVVGIGRKRQIPCSTEQGIISAEQEILAQEQAI
jgi:hypothetical protein